MIDQIIKINYIVGKFAERRIAKVKHQQTKLKLLQKLSDFYSKQYAGILHSSFIEAELIKLSSEIKTTNTVATDKDHTLHVATMVGADGGHTRIILNWIKNQTTKKHSLLINTQCTVPEWLNKAVTESGGQVILNEQQGYIPKALFLKTHSLAYESIVLHVHTNDMLPLLAYGSNFTKPVALFNHADHTFWLGSAITDMVYDLNSYSADITRKLRGVRSNTPLPIVIDEGRERDYSKSELRDKYGIPQDKRVLVSMASKHKFLGQSNIFFKTIPALLDDSTIMLLMGPQNKKQFKQLAKITAGKVIPMGYQDKDTADDLLRLSDIYIDSFPVSSFTSMLQAVRAGIPVVTNFQYELPDSLLENRVSDLTNINTLSQNEIRNQFLLPAKEKLSMHFGKQWQVTLEQNKLDTLHKVEISPESFTPHPYIQFVYSASIKHWQWFRRVLNMILLSSRPFLSK